MDIGRDFGIKLHIINPNDYFNILYKFHESEKEVRNFDLRHVKTSDLIIVNFNDPNSIGTAQELAVGYELKIPIVGFHADKHRLHPWLVECCERIFSKEELLIEYIKNFYLL